MTHWRSQEGELRHAPPRNWVHKKIPGCAVELNTQNCAWFGSQISLIIAMSFREAMLPPNYPPGALPLDSAGDFRFPDPLCPPPPNPGYATEMTCKDASDFLCLNADGGRYADALIGCTGDIARLNNSRLFSKSSSIRGTCYSVSFHDLLLLSYLLHCVYSGITYHIPL